MSGAVECVRPTEGGDEPRGTLLYGVVGRLVICRIGEKPRATMFEGRNCRSWRSYLYRWARGTSPQWRGIARLSERSRY